MHNDGEIEVDVRYEVADFRRPRFTLATWGMLTILGLLSVFGLVAIAGVWLHPEAGAKSGLPTYFVPPAALALILLQLYVAPILLLKRTREDGKDAVRYTVSSGGIGVAYPMASTVIPWEAIAKYVETRSDFLLYFSAAALLPIPKRCFASEQQIDAFREIVGEGMPHSLRMPRRAQPLLKASLLIAAVLLLWYVFSHR